MAAAVAYVSIQEPTFVARFLLDPGTNTAESMANLMSATCLHAVASLDGYIAESTMAWARRTTLPGTRYHGVVGCRWWSSTGRWDEVAPYVESVGYTQPWYSERDVEAPVGGSMGSITCFLRDGDRPSAGTTTTDAATTAGRRRLRRSTSVTERRLVAAASRPGTPASRRRWR